MLARTARSWSSPTCRRWRRTPTGTSLVEKASDGSVTSSGLTALDDEGRERELSRMLAGLADSDTALAHARELLEVAQPGCASKPVASVALG